MDKFTYEGWEFTHENDGSLMIQPNVVSQGSGVFGEPNKQADTNRQSISIPRDQVHRLIGYCLTGKTSGNDQVLNSIRDLEKQYQPGLVGAGTTGTK